MDHRNSRSCMALIRASRRAHSSLTLRHNFRLTHASSQKICRLLTGVRLVLLCLVAGMFFIAFSGCSAPSPQVRYYSLIMPQPEQSPEQSPAPLSTEAHDENAGQNLVLSVGPVSLPELLSAFPIATTANNTHGQVYVQNEDHRWAGRLDTEISRSLAEQLRRELTNSQVIIFPDDLYLVPNCRLLLDILSMGGSPGDSAELSVRWSLVDPQKTKRPIIRYSSFSKQLTEPGYGAWVDGQRANLHRMSLQIAPEIQRYMQPATSN